MKDQEIAKILKENKNIAVVGISRNEEKAAHNIPKFLKKKGYKIIPVNPYADKIFSEKTYSSLSEVKEKIDIVEIFRPSEETYEIVKEALKTDAKVIWMQKGIKSDESRILAEKNGLKVIQDHCMKLEYEKLIENK
ncbi:hypothetical protein AKJ50_01925 [candidate division MSBL1 archaeon SCGC-AAA382A13]|uniref:CoA-binding domain-containing protein n=1 Tax=candidate division MSBL1 archaeon SCGC-AAA382A13 TaxID=1698279 RepID=A0A133VEM2_9EURY|nr:hypothetical protein AKJ50_01925 [candidate division MSBL1 archaeon SCGC-AAA382A13]